MMTLLRGLQSIAAPRGGGLRPELLRMATRLPAWSGGEHMDGTACDQHTDGRPADEMEHPTLSAGGVPMPLRMRDNIR